MDKDKIVAAVSEMRKKARYHRGFVAEAKMNYNPNVDSEKDRILMEQYEQIAEWLTELLSYKTAEEQGLLHRADIPNGTTIYVWREDEDGLHSIHSEAYLHGFTEYVYGQLGKDFWMSEEEAMENQ